MTDTEMMDWMERHSASINRGERGGKVYTLITFSDSAGKRWISEGLNLRDAIAGAIVGEKKSK